MYIKKRPFEINDAVFTIDISRDSLFKRLTKATVTRKLSGCDLAEWLERLTANAEDATALGPIPASSDTVA